MASIGENMVLDWFSVIAPILLSVVAICISISTARKQNKIALFEKRYETLEVLLKIKHLRVSGLSDFYLSFSTSFFNNKERAYKEIINESFGDKEDARILSKEITKIIQKVNQIPFLFSLPSEDINEFILTLETFLNHFVNKSLTSSQKDVVRDRELFIKSYDKQFEKILREVKKCLILYNL